MAESSKIPYLRLFRNSRCQSLLSLQCSEGEKEKGGSRCDKSQSGYPNIFAHRSVLLCYLVFRVSFFSTASVPSALSPKIKIWTSHYVSGSGVHVVNHSPVCFSVIFFFFVRIVQTTPRKRQKRVAAYVYAMCIRTTMTCDNSFRNIRVLRKSTHVASWRSTSKLITNLQKSRTQSAILTTWGVWGSATIRKRSAAQLLTGS